VGKDDVLGLSAMVQHHLVGFSSKTRFLVTSKGSMGRIKVVAVHPNTTSFNVASQFHSTVDISGPNTSTMILTGVCSAGFKTTVFPAAKAGANFQVAINKGKFHGMICPQTPRGSLR